jgi:acetate kinase
MGRPILTINAGSSSIRFALFGAGPEPAKLLSGTMDRIGLGETTLRVVEADGQRRDVSDASMTAAKDHATAAAGLIEWLDTRFARGSVAAIGHRVVHGGPRYGEPQRVTPEVMKELRRLVPFAPNHMPAAVALIEAFGHHYPAVPQIACFDTAFHHDLPPVARTLPIPRRYAAQGVRRYGFHGLSYAYLIEELARVTGPTAADGRVILAHLGNGASMAAIHHGRCIDTSMGFTPMGGLMMGTRTGDIDPGVLTYLIREDGMSVDDLENLVSKQSGLLGVSGKSPDMRTLLASEHNDPHAAEAIDLFCYQAKKWIGALAAALGGLDTLIFSGGIGEHAPPVRARICDGLQFLGVQLDEARNTANAPVISIDGSPATVRVIPTDEEVMIAKAVNRTT